ncbi:PRC-barrel domain-containing protein [Chelativorans sp. YIM 93263]|uniref:PRC-barrel domain-containing protein n=1 Tax=Chelativorans sp. YIM 93263 TaxID=2906648 RepID=UPI0023784DA3|nr:PRC-barrel domain-containing protein [Chelativorans sp. YIM 93263]
MIRNLLATTAIATLVATGAVAQTTTGEEPVQNQNQQQEMSVRAEGHLASNLMGEAVYNGTGDEAENIGDVTDMIINDDGNIEAIVVGVGGFLGIGQKEVALEYDVVQWEEQQDGERRIVVETTADALESQPEFDRTAFRPMPADADVAETTPASRDDLASAPQNQDGQQTDQQADVSPLEGDQDSETASTDSQQDVEADQDVAADQGTDVQVTEQTAQTDDQQTQTGDQQTTAQTDDQQTQTGDQQTTAQTDDQQTQTGDQQTTAQTDDQQTTEETGDRVAVEDTTAEDEQTAQSDTGTANEDQDVDVQVTEQTAQTDEQGQNQDSTDEMQTAAVDQSTLQQAQPDQVRAENLTGTTVYGSNEESVGEIGDVILTPEGDVDAVIVDVGGFLGIGQKEVALSIDNLAFMTDENGDLYLYTQFTEEQLDAQPEYDQATYAEQRDQMLLQSE